jgi:hypothetical protein
MSTAEYTFEYDESEVNENGEKEYIIHYNDMESFRCQLSDSKYINDWPSPSGNTLWAYDDYFDEDYAIKQLINDDMNIKYLMRYCRDVEKIHINDSPDFDCISWLLDTIASDNTTLTDLDFSNLKGFKDNDCDSLCNILKNCPLEKLKLNGYKYDIFEEKTVKKLADALKESDLQYFACDDLGQYFNIIVKAFVDHKSITTLDLSNNKIVDSKQLCKLIRGNTLKSLNLSNCQISFDIAKDIKESIIESNPFDVLYLNNSFIDQYGESIIPDIMGSLGKIEMAISVHNEIIMETLVKNKSIRTFKMSLIDSKNDIPIGSSIVIKNNKNLRSLDINGYNIIAEQFAVSLEESVLNKLDLSDNMISQNGLKSIVKRCHNIEILNLSKDCIIKDICKKLRKNDSIRELSFNNEYIDKEDMISIKKLINANGNIKILRISGSYLDTSVVVNIIKENKTLRELHLSNMYIDITNMANIIKALEDNITLIRLDLSCFDDWIFIRKRTRDLFKKNKTIFSFGNRDNIDDHTVYYLNKNGDQYKYNKIAEKEELQFVLDKTELYIRDIQNIIAGYIARTHYTSHI